jgi:peptide/nickel transport system ATP-binding protein
LRKLVSERRMALVVVTHDMGVVAALADEVVVMRNGRVVEQGPVARLLTSPTHEYTRTLLAATPRLDSPPTPRPDVAPPRSPALRVRDLAVHHRLRGAGFGKARVLEAVAGLSLDMCSGEALGVVGESGCGKSTLARALLRLSPLTRGQIVWLGRAIESLEREELRTLRSSLQLVFQDPVASLDPTQRVMDIVAEPLRALRPWLDARQRAARVDAMLSDVGLGPEFTRRLSRELSGGQCQRVAIARAMVLEPKLLVCDEAVSSLDVSIQAQLLDLFADIKQRHGTAILFVSHNLAVVRRLCERVLVMYLGRVVESGPTERVFNEPQHPYTRMLLESVPRLEPLAERQRLANLAATGETPSAVDPPGGCAFHTRCPYAEATCAITRPGPEQVDDSHDVACLRWRDIVKKH